MVKCLFECMPVHFSSIVHLINILRNIAEDPRKGSVECEVLRYEVNIGGVLSREDPHNRYTKPYAGDSSLFIDVYLSFCT